MTFDKNVSRLIFSKKFIWPPAVILLIAVYYFTPLSRRLPDASHPLWQAGGLFFRTGKSVKNFWNDLASARVRSAQIARLERANAALLAENARLKFLETANSQLRSLANLPKPSAGQSALAADVLTASSLYGRRFLVINRGADDGVKSGLAVISPSGVLLGKISEVAKKKSRVVLITDNDSVIAGRLANNPAIQLVVRGKMGISAALELISQDTQLAIGDLVVSSALEENTPPGLLIGKITAIEYREGDLFKKAYLAPLFNANDLNAVGVILQIGDL